MAETGGMTVTELARVLDLPVDLIIGHAADQHRMYGATHVIYATDDRSVLTGPAAEAITGHVREARAVLGVTVDRPGTPPLQDVAEFMIRMDMAMVDARGGETGPWTPGVMRWAVRVAGHLFDAHDLWDYDLVSDADHVHRCFTHRHLSRTLKDRRLSRAQ